MLSKTPLHQIVDRTTLDPWRKALLDAADYIERYGHCKFTLEDRNGSVCLLGAVSKFSCLSGTSGLRELGDFVGCKSYELAAWNNTVERTPDEVMGAMRECALKGIL